MPESLDEMLQYLESRRDLAKQNRDRHTREWDVALANYWQGYLSGIALAIQKFRPHINQSELPFADDVEDREQPQPQYKGPIGETENLLPDCGAEAPDAAGHFVLVPCKALVDALRRMTRFRKKSARREMLSISFRNGILRFSMMNVSEGIPAEGVWANDVLVNCGILYNLAGVPPKDDPVVIRVSDGNLYIDSAVTPVQLG